MKLAQDSRWKVMRPRAKLNAQQLKSRADLAMISSQFSVLRRVGPQLRGLCPLHSERHPSFYVHPIRQVFYCFGCGQGGDVFSFIRALRHCSFSEAMAEVEAWVYSGFLATDRPTRGREHCPPKAGRRPEAVARRDSWTSSTDWKPTAAWRARRFGVHEIPGSQEYVIELQHRDIPPSFFPETATQEDVRNYQRRGFFAGTSANN